jgi:F-type H+-transporting ATPase subunit delta
MMARFRALPYAKALLRVVQASEPQRAETVADELDRVAEALAEVPQFLRVLVTPMVDTERKSQILDEVLDELAVGQPTRRFLHVVQSHYRMLHMRDIAASYRELVDRSLGRVRARIETASELAQRDRERLLATVSQHEGAKVVADFVANRELLGGFKLQVGSRVFDGSLAGDLDRLSRQIEIEQG